MTLPLALKWQHDFTAQSVASISYPIIAQGSVFVTTNSYPNAATHSLVAFDESTGEQSGLLLSGETLVFSMSPTIRESYSSLTMTV